MKPNCFLIGAPKCGTTAVASYLAEHPEVFFSNPKEPLFWSQEDFPRAAHEPAITTIAGYQNLFARADAGQHRIVAEGSTRYLYSPTALQRINAFNPDCRFLVMVRDPLSLAEAYHMEMVYSRHENIEDFATAWKASADRAEGRRVPRACPAPGLLDYRSVIRLGRQVERLLSLVGPERVLVATLDDLRHDPQHLYARILSFLDLDDDGRTHFPVVNGAHQHRSAAVANLVLSPPQWLAPTMLRARDGLGRSGRLGRSLKVLMNQRMVRVPTPPDLARQIMDSTRHDVAVLEQLLDQDLSHWFGQETPC